MASKMRWKYKNTALVLKPWIMHILIDGNLKQKAQKVQVVKIKPKSIAASPHPDGHLMKVISDGQVYIRALFTPEALDHLNGCSETDPPPVLDGKMLILIDYLIDFLPSDRLEYCEFSLVVSKLTILADLTGFDNKHDPVHCMSLTDVRKKCSLLWDQWRNKALDMSFSSLPLTQLLEELGQQSLDMEEGKEAERAEVSTASIMHPQEFHQNTEKSRLCSEIDLTEVCISKADMDYLETITEWQEGYKPPKTQSSSKHSSEEAFSKVFNSKSTLRGEKARDNRRKSLCLADNKISVRVESKERNDGKHKEDNRKRFDETKEKALTTADAEIQVSQSLWIEFLDNQRKNLTTTTGNQSKEATTTTGNQGKEATTTTGNQGKDTTTVNQGASKETSDDIIAEKSEENAVAVTADNNNSDSVVDISTPENPEKSPELKIDEFSPSLLLPLGYLTSAEQIGNKDPITIEDSFGDDKSMKDSTKIENPGENTICKTVKTSSKKVEKDQNDNDSPIIIDEIEVPMEISNHRNELSNHRNNLLNDLKQKNPLHSKGAVALEEQDEENRLFELKYQRISGSFNSSKTLDKSFSENFAQNETRRSLRSNVTRVSESPNVDFKNISKITEKSKRESSRSDEDVKGHGGSKRKATMSDSEIFAKTRRIENSKKPVSKKNFLRSRPSIGNVSQENNNCVEKSVNSLNKCIITLEKGNTGDSSENLVSLHSMNRSSDNGTIVSKKTGNKIMEKLQRTSVENYSEESVEENLLQIQENCFDSATSNICENVNKKDTVCQSSVTEQSKIFYAKDNKFSTLCKIVDQSPDVIISPPLVLSGQSDDHSGNFLNDAQVIGSGETHSGNVGQKSGLACLSGDSINPGETVCTPGETVGTPGNSLPSYQPPRHLPTPGGTPTERGPVSNLRETFWGLFEPEPLSEVGKTLMNLTFPEDLMKKMEASLSRS